MIYNIYVDDNIVFDRANWSNLSPIEYRFSDPEDADIFCVGIKKHIDDEYLSGCNKIKYILSPATGLDHISEPVKKRYNIINLIPSEVEDIRASSEFTIFLVLSILRKSQEIFNKKYDIVGEEICGKTVGLLGYGRIAKNIHKVFEAMGAKVIFHDTAISDSLSKKEVLQSSDIVIVLVSCTKENMDYISNKDFINMKRKPYFINVTRGFVVNEYALLNALTTKRIKGAALDVVEDMHIFTDYLKNNDNLIITPHLAGSTYQSYEKACNYTIKKLKEKITRTTIKS